MIGKSIAQYTILEKIGSGGMGVVYKAKDVKLDRFVALKFLSPHLSHEEEQKKRFLHEARAASALDHPNICPVYEISETDDDQLFIVMPYYESESLRDRVHQGVLPVYLAIDIAVQAAEGLAKAHAKGIVHRDVKPANILLTPENQVKIVDFGLAKLVNSSLVARDGVILGTVAYMSPEQSSGSFVNERTDIWSLGVVLYEMLSGHLPFSGDTEHAVIHSILYQEMKPIDSKREALPAQIEPFLKRVLQKDPKKRLESMTAFSRELRALQPATPSEFAITVGRENIEMIPSIGVLPFTNMSADPEQEYFCDGMAEEIINSLAKLEGLRVSARTSTFAFKNKNEDVREIGKKLNVEMVLEGSVRRAGDRLRITAQLINVDNGFHVWSERYDRKLEDVFAIQDDISQAVVTALKITLKVQEKEELLRRPTENMEAYDNYLRGIYFFNQRTEEGADHSITLLERAVHLDPEFAAAYAGLADAYIEKFFTYNPQEVFRQKAMSSLEKALALDPLLADAHVAKGNLVWSVGFDHEKAIEEHRRAIAINPNLAAAHNELGRVLWHIGALDKAHACLEKALQLDPTSIDAQFRMAWLAMNRGDWERSRLMLSMLPKESVAQWASSISILCLIYMNRMEEAAKMLRTLCESIPDSPTIASIDAIFHAVSGQPEEAFRRIKVAFEKGKGLGHFHHISHHAACTFAILNRTSEALDQLETTAADGFPCYSFFETDPLLANIRNEPRFQSLIASLKQKWERFSVE